MTRPEHVNAAGLTAAEVGSLSIAVAAVAEQVRLAFLGDRFCRISTMKGFLETAVNSQATGIVSFNRRDFALAPRQVGIAVLSPVGALSRLEQEQ